jgi:hypothetical protein
LVKTTLKAAAVACFLLAAWPVFGVERNGCYPTPSDLLASWPAEGTAADMAGYYSGILEGGTGYGQGLVGEAFDRTRRSVEHPNSNIQYPTSNIQHPTSSN